MQTAGDVGHTYQHGEDPDIKNRSIQNMGGGGMSPSNCTIGDKECSWPPAPYQTHTKTHRYSQ